MTTIQRAHKQMYFYVMCARGIFTAMCLVVCLLDLLRNKELTHVNIYNFVFACHGKFEIPLEQEDEKGNIIS